MLAAVADGLAGKNVRKLVKDGLVIRKPAKNHSRARTRAYLEAKRKGRHTGRGKRRGTRNARMPQKVLWVRRTRILRRMLVKYRAQKKIDKHLCAFFALHLRPLSLSIPLSLSSSSSSPLCLNGNSAFPAAFGLRNIPTARRLLCSLSPFLRPEERIDARHWGILRQF